MAPLDVAGPDPPGCTDSPGMSSTSQGAKSTIGANNLPAGLPARTPSGLQGADRQGGRIGHPIGVSSGRGDHQGWKLQADAEGGTGGRRSAVWDKRVVSP